MTNHTARARTALSLALVGGATTLALVAAGGASGQATGVQAIGIAPQTSGNATLTGTDALHPGPATITVAKTAKEVDLTLFELKPGVTQDQVAAAASRIKGPPTPLQRYGRFVFGSTSTKAAGYAATVTLEAATYLVVDSTRAPKFVGTFTVAPGPASGTAPAPDATVTLSNFRIRAPATIAPGALVRFTNRGMSPHFVVMAHAGSHADAKKVAMDLKMGREKAAQKLIKGFAAPLGVISPGVSNDVPLTGVGKGWWVMACFYSDATSHGKEHTMLGMETVVHVA